MMDQVSETAKMDAGQQAKIIGVVFSDQIIDLNVKQCTKCVDEGNLEEDFIAIAFQSGSRNSIDMSVRKINDPEKSLFFSRQSHEQKFNTFGIGLGKWKAKKQGKCFLGLGKCRDRVYGDQINILTATTDKIGTKIENLTYMTMIEDISREFKKFFDNETYVNYEIYKSQNKCLSRSSKN
jgi:hypothetical protein